MTWKNIIQTEQEKEYYKNLKIKLDEKYNNEIILPKKEDIFNAFDLTKFEDIKVVILGQDPYYRIGQAHGLAFSTPKEIKNPPSMINILKEINDDLKRESICKNGDLTSWAKQGILLLNTILTVQEGLPKSHHNIGWEIFTDNIIKNICEYKENIIFLLWGANAVSKSKLINKNKHFILTAPHPSPLSVYRGFYGCSHFSKTNEILNNINKEIINW